MKIDVICMLKKKGFTLTELLVVVAILGVLLLIAVPSINKVVDNSKLSASVSSAKNYITGIQYKFAGNSKNNSVKHYLVNNITYIIYNGCNFVKNFNK